MKRARGERRFLQRGWRASRRDIILILLPGRDARSRRRRRIYGQFFLLIFITSTCERGSATKRVLLLSRFSFAFDGTRVCVRRQLLSALCMWNSIFSSPSRDPYLVELYSLYPGRNIPGILEGTHKIELCRSRKDNKLESRQR